MNIPKAIEILTDDLKSACEPSFSDRCKATKLGIEALEFIDYCRSGDFDPPFELLPGETKD